MQNINKVSKFYIVIQGEIKPFTRMSTDLVNYHFKQIHIIEKDDLEKYLTNKFLPTRLLWAVGGCASHKAV
jgi:hypothetical protein